MASVFKQVAPCADCPFLRSGAIELNPGRLDGIIADLLRGQNFLCHTRYYSHPRVRQPCAGAIIYLEKARRPNHLMIVMQMLGDYPRARFLRHAKRVIDP